SVINGRAAAADSEGSATARRTMRGLRAMITSNVFRPGVNGFPNDSPFSEEQLNSALREIWKNSSGHVDLVVVGGQEKRAINAFIASSRRYAETSQTFRDGVAVYESDFGVCRVVLSRWVPQGCVLLLDSSRIEVLPLSGR